jgi:hypothetical protein
MLAPYSVPSLLLIALLTSVCPGRALASDPRPEGPRHEPAPSVIELPVTVELGPLARFMEQRIPGWIVRREGWERYRDVGVQYGVWRGPVQVAMFGEVLHVQIPVWYWVKARKKVLGSLELSGSCGVHEPPRTALIRLAARLAWTPDGRLVPQGAILPVRYLSPCRMTIAQLDVTPLLDRYVREKLGSMARKALDAQLPRLTDLRRRLQAAWAALGQPLPLGEGAWMLLQPEAVRVGSVHGSGARVSTRVGLVVRPRVVLGDRPPPVAMAAPPKLRPALPTGAGVRLPVRVELRYTDVSQALAARLVGRVLKVGTDTLTLSAPAVSASGSRLALSLRVGGSAEGSLTVKGRPVIDADSDMLSLEDLELESRIEDPVADAALGLFRNLILRHLAAHARWHLGAEMESARQRLEESLNREIGRDLTLRVRIHELRPTAVRAGRQSIVAELAARGTAQVHPAQRSE